MINYRCLALLMLLVLMAACGSQKEIQQTASPKPTWLEQRPATSRYYIGIGMADTNYHPVGYQQAAKREALADLASEIQVKIDTRSMLYQLEDRERFRESYQSATQLQANQLLEGYQLMDSWRKGSRYWVYYRLDKKAYRQQQAEKKQQAAEQGWLLFQQGEKMETNGHFALATNQYLQALTTVEPYLGKPLILATDEGEVEVGMRIYQKLLDLNNALEVQFSPSKASGLYEGLKPDRPLSTLRLRYRGKDYGKARLQVYAHAKSREISTGPEGRWAYQPDRITETRYVVEATFSMAHQVSGIDWEMHPLSKGMLEKIPVKTAVLVVEAQPAYCRVKVEGGRPSIPLSLKPAFENALRKGGFRYATAKSPFFYRLEVKIKERDQKTANGVHIHYLDFDWRLLDREGVNLLSGQIHNIKGAQLKAHEARRQAYQNVYDVLEDELRFALRDWLKAP